MAKKAKTVVNDGIDKALLAAISSGQVTEVDKPMAEAAGMLFQPAPLIEVGGVDIQTGKAPVRITDAGKAYLAMAATPTAAVVNEPTAETFAIITGAALPPSKRGNTGGGAPIKYPFDKLEIGQSFFVAVSEKLPNPVKTLGSTVSSANMRYAKETGEFKEVERAKRNGKKAALDANGNKIMEKKSVPVYKFERKFSIRGVTKGENYGSWVAPDNGALIARTE